MSRHDRSVPGRSVPGDFLLTGALLAVGLVLRYLALGRVVALWQERKLTEEPPIKLAFASEILIAAGFLLGGLSLLARSFTDELAPAERVAYVLGGVGLLIAAALSGDLSQFKAS